MEILDKVQIGTLVQVNLELSKDRLTKETIDAIKISPECKVSDFKITDGKGIGVVLKLSNGKEQWFFENEIEILDNNGNIIENEENINQDFLTEFFANLDYKPKNKIEDLLNPFNFIIWLIVSIKDIF